ncbi:MAG: GtrA family protein [Treponema sp.]|jgi:putative flippase GtrA|nr:GtrA family protein [Treponema sp.]
MNIKTLFDKVFLKFLIVGIINTLVGSVIMFVLYNAVHMSYWFSSGCNYFLSSILSFFLNKYFTFTVKRWSVFMIISFIVTIVVSYYVPFWIAKHAVNYFLQNCTEKFRGNIALIAGTCLASAVSYFGQRFVVFRKK